jgi:hypothetical protein
LPIELKRLILSKVWQSGKDFNILRLSKGELLLPLNLKFLFAQHGHLKHTTQPLISKGCGAWNGSFLKKSVYVFTYDTLNLKSKVLIPDFLTPKGPMSVDGFLGSSGRLSRRQKHERSTEILKEGGPM